MRVWWILASVSWAMIGAVLVMPAFGLGQTEVVDTITTLITTDSNQSTMAGNELVTGHDAPGPDDAGPDDAGPDDAGPDETGERETGSESDPDSFPPVDVEAPDRLAMTMQGEDVAADLGLVAVWDLTEGEDVPLIGYKDNVDFDVHIPAGWIAGEGALTARISSSGQARSDASIRVDIASKPVGSWSNGQDAEVEFPVSLDRFDDAEVSVDFTTTTPLDDDPVCLDPNHVARWLEVENPMLTSAIKPVSLDVTRAVRGIGTVSRITGEPVHVITTKPPSPNVLEVIGNLAAAIGHYGLPHHWNVVFNGEAPPERGAQIWIDEDPDVTPHVAVRVVDDRPILELVGSSSGLVWLSEALADVDRIDYFHHSQVVAEDIPRGAAFPLREVFRFEDDGYDDRTLRGSGPQSLIYRVHIPAGVPPDVATLALYATHSPHLADVGSTISVRINGSPEEIVAVANSTGQLDALHTVAPANLRPGLNYVKITTQLAAIPGALGACGGSSGGPAWFTVSNTSGLGVERPPELQKVRLGVEDARFALASPVDFNGADVVVADGGSAADIELAVEVIGQLSSRAQGGSPRLVSDGQADPGRHLIVVGADQGRELLQSVPKVTRGAVAADDNLGAQALGIVAAQPSPFSDGKVMLAFTGATTAGAQRAVATAMSADVNDVISNFALISPDTVRPIGSEGVRFEDLDVHRDAPGDLAFDDGSAVNTPDGDEYEQWVLQQAQRIEASRGEEQDRRRIIALSLFVFASIVAGLWWVQRTRRMDEAGGH